MHYAYSYSTVRHDKMQSSAAMVIRQLTLLVGSQLNSHLLNTRWQRVRVSVRVSVGRIGRERGPKKSIYIQD
jgi:hypothetical protein